MAVQTVQTTGDVPKVLEPFYLGKGTPGTKGYEQGLIERGIAQLFPAGKTGTEAFKNIYGDVFKAGLMGEGAVAPLTQSQIELGQRISGLDLPSQYTTAANVGQQAAAGLQGLQDLQVSGVAAPELTQFQMTGPTSITAPELQQFQIGAPTQEALDPFMSPYMQNVVDIQQRKAVEAAQQAQLGQNLAAARQGTYGGARQALVQAQRESGLRQQLGDIQAQGLQSAFDQAQQLRQRTAEQNLAAQLGVQQLGSGQSLQAQQANQAALQAAAQQNLQAALGVQQLGAGQSLEAQRANQAAELQAAQQRLAASQGLTGLAGTLGQLGTQQLAGELDITKTMGAYGDLQRAVQQQQLDAERQMLMDQAQYGQTQVGQLSNLLRGIPLSDTTQTSTTPAPSFASQLTGLGLTGLGLYNMLGQPPK